MQKVLRIIEIFSGVVVGLPVFVVTVYNLYRQEVNPSAPPLIDVLPDWHWGIWLSVLLLICLVMIILELFRRSSGNSSVHSHTESGGQSITAGRDNYGNLIGSANIVIPDETKILEVRFGLIPEQKVNREVLPTSRAKKFGHVQGVGIRVENKSGYEIKSVATLEKVDRLVLEDGRLVPAQQPGANFGLMPSGKLRWRNHGFWDCEIMVPAESRNEIILVSEIKTLFSMDNLTFPFKPSINGLFFALCDVTQQNTHMQMNSYGVYQIEVRMNGKVSRNEISVNRFIGFVYYYSDDFFIGEGSALHDTRIIERLEQDKHVKKSGRKQKGRSKKRKKGNPD